MPPTPCATDWKAIRDAVAARRLADRAQLTLISDSDAQHETLLGKLRGFPLTRQIENLHRCGHECIYRVCRDCRDIQRFPYACSIKWCPRCNWRIAERRRKLLTIWSASVKQPKHIVLTQKNFDILTRKKLRSLTDALARLRRQEVWRDMAGGCTSIELTHEGEGWHLHTHTLADGRWIDAGELAVTWGKLVGQSFGVVKVKDVRGQDYTREVSKYVVKGSDLAAWPPDLIWQFLTAVRGRRFFFQFGSLLKLGKKIRAQIADTKADPPTCDCGCSRFVFEQEQDHELRAILRQEQTRPRTAASASRPSANCTDDKELGDSLPLLEPRKNTSFEACSSDDERVPSA